VICSTQFPCLTQQLDGLGVQVFRHIPLDRHAGGHDEAARPVFAQERESRSRRMISVESEKR